jgi:CheY-like chemotaxis protein
MNQRYTSITDQRAEGSPDSHEQREPATPQQTSVTPAVRPLSHSRSPVAETGLVPAVSLPAEGADNSDVQDAALTTSETIAAAQSVPSTAKARPMNALIVEDTLELAEILQVTLQRMQITTTHESQVARAVSRIHDMEFDVVLLDIGLPDGPGWKVLDSIKEMQRSSGGKAPNVIVITAYGDAANRLVGKLHGVFRYLVKPFTPSEVESVVRNALSSAAG